MIKEAIANVVEGKHLSRVEAEDTMSEIMAGEATDAQIAALITALRMKGETVDEIAGFASIMREKATAVPSKRNIVVDTCGTGGDGSRSFNISTVAAFVTAGAGICVAKHGNRSVSSQCGSADVLMELGVNVEADVETLSWCLDHVGLAFLFAPMLHRAMKYAIGPRREVGIRTVFNVLGPLCNPAKARYQLMGVFDVNLTADLANVLKSLGSERALVVHGRDGLDEITITEDTQVSELRDGEVRTHYIRPEDVGLNRCDPQDLLGGDPTDNARILLNVLQCEEGPCRDIVLFNAGAAIYVAGAAPTIDVGVSMAAEAIDSGSALQKLEELKDATKEGAKA